MTGDVTSGGRDYYQVVGRLYFESADPQGEDENHKGKLFVKIYESVDGLRFETQVERSRVVPRRIF